MRGNAKAPARGAGAVRCSGWARGLPAHPSEGDAVRAEVGDGVEVRAVVGTRTGLEVQVRAGDVAGRAGEADLLARGDLLAGRDIDRRQVAVLGVGAVVHLDDDLVAVRAAPAGLDDRAGADGLDGRAVRGAEVDTGLAAGGPDGAAGLVAGGHVGARDRRDEGVETLTLGLAGCALLLGADLLCLLGGLLARGLLGRLAGLGLGGLTGGLVLGGRLGVDPVGDGVAEGDDGGDTGLGRCGFGGQRGCREGADDAAAGQGRDARRASGAAVDAAGAAVLAGGAGERHVQAGPFLPSRLPG